MAALSPTPNDVFKFATFRDPNSTIESNLLVVKVVDENFDLTKFYEELIETRKSKEPEKSKLKDEFLKIKNESKELLKSQKKIPYNFIYKILKLKQQQLSIELEIRKKNKQLAQSLLKSNRFVSSYEHLELNFKEFRKQLHYNSENISMQLLQGGIKKIFGMGPSSLIKLDKYKQDRLKVSDSLIASNIISPSNPQLVEMMKMFGLIEEMVRENPILENKIADLRWKKDMIVTLPLELFPRVKESYSSLHYLSKFAQEENKRKKIRMLLTKMYKFQKARNELDSINGYDLVVKENPQSKTPHSISESAQKRSQKE